MNIQAVSSKHSLKLAQVKEICKANNWDITNISEDQEKQIVRDAKNNGMGNRQLGSANTQSNLSPNQNPPKDLITNSSQDINPYSKERSNDRIKKLISSAQLAGQSEAELYNAVKTDAFLNHTQNSDDNIFNEFINGAIAHSIQLKHVANHAGEVNSISSSQPLDIEAIDVERVDIAQLQSNEDDIIARGFQKLLGSAD